MNTNGKKVIATVIEIMITVGAFVTFMYVNSSNNEVIQGYTVILFGIVPALMINSIWNTSKKQAMRNL